MRGLEEKVGWECYISREEAGGPDSAVEVYKLGGSHGDGRCGISRRSRDAAGRAAPGVRAAKSAESRKEE